MTTLPQSNATTEANQSVIVRKVKVNRNRTPFEVLSATGRALELAHPDDGWVELMPKGEGDEVEVVFFKLGVLEHIKPEDAHLVRDGDLKAEYDLRGLKPADPFSVAAVNEADPAFADQRPNGTHWETFGIVYCIGFFLWPNSGARTVEIGRHGFHLDCTWFAGLRK